MIKLVSNWSEFRTEHLKMPVYAVRNLGTKLPQTVWWCEQSDAIVSAYIASSN